MANSKNITFDQLQAALSRVKSALDGKANTSHGNHVPKTETANNARFLRNDNTWQTVTPVNIGAADRSHTHGEYINQNTFTNIKIGDTTIEADSPTDTLTLNAGANVTITPDAINDVVTIEAKDTIYTHPTNPGNRHIPSGGSSGQILRWSEDGTAAWGSENNTFTNGSVGGFTVTPNNLVGDNVGMTSSSGHGFALWAGANGADASNVAPFRVGHEGRLYAYDAVLAGTLDGNATTATRLQTAHKFTIGNSEKSFDGSSDVSWSLDEIGAAHKDHAHTFLHLGNAESISEENDNSYIWGAYYNSVRFYVPGTIANQPTDWGFLINIGHPGEVHQIWAAQANGDLLHRGGNATALSSEWKKILDSTNYTDFTVTKNGVGAFGTWGIDVSGNAATTTKLQTPRSVTIGKSSKTVDGSEDVAWSLAEIGAMGANTNGQYYGLINPTGDDQEWIRTTRYGLIPYQQGGCSSIGTSVWPFEEGYINTIYGHLVGNADTSTKLTSARKLTIGNTERSFDGSADVSWTLGEIGAASVDHMHTSINHLGNVFAQSTGERASKDGLSMQLVYNNGYPYSYGNVLNLKGTGDGQLFIGWSGSTGAHAPVYVRSKRDNGDAWSDWAQFYTTANPQTDITGNAGTATKLATAKTITIGNTGKQFDGSGNVSWSLDEIGAVSPSHTHDRIIDSNNSIIVAQANDHCGLDAVNNVNVATWYGFSISNNCSNTDNYGQVTFSVDARSGQVWTRGTVNAPAFSGALYGNANTATTLANSRKFTIGNSEKYFNGSADVSWTLDEMGVTSAIAQSGNSILNTVSNTYATKAELNDLEIGGTNLVLNSSFLRGATNWSINGVTWDDITTIAESTSPTGNALKISVNTTYGGYGIFQHVTPRKTGNYTLSFYAKADTDNYRIYFGQEGSTAREIALTTNWTKYTHTYNRAQLDSNAIIFYTLGNTANGAFYLHSIKLEYGNKATDWSPAPEDIDASITLVDNKFASYSTTQQMNSSIEQKANEIMSSVSSMYSTKTETDDKINNIRIGGTNLFRGTANLDSKYWTSENASLTDSYYRGSRIYRVSYAWTDYNYPVRYLFEDDVIELNTEYTFSCYARTNNGDYRPNLGIYGDSAHMEGNGLYIGTVGTEWRQYSGIIKFYDGNRDYVLRIEPATESGDNNKYIEICGLKLEKGNKATDWSPNPNDTDIVNPNLLKNGRFKGLHAGVVDNVPDWIASGGLTVWHDIGQPGYENKGCIYFHKEALDGAGCYLYQDLDMDDIGRNVPLTLSFDAWREETIAEVGCRVEYINVNKDAILASKNLNVNDFAGKLDSNGHRSYTFTTSNDSNVKYLRVVFYYISADGASGGYLVTLGNVKLEHGMCETPWLQTQQESIATKISGSGGYNLLRNGRALNGVSYWVNNGGGISVDSGNAPTVDYKYFCTNFPGGITYYDWIQLENNTHYIYSAKIYVTEPITFSGITPLHYWATHNKSGGQSQASIVRSSHEGQTIPAGQWVDVWVEYVTAPRDNVWFKPFIYQDGSTCSIAVTDLMLCKGSVPFAWSPHPSEIYDGVTQIDKDGIKVMNTGISNNSFVHTSSNGFTLHKDGENLLNFGSDGLHVKGNIVATSGSIPSSILNGQVPDGLIGEWIRNGATNGSNAITRLNGSAGAWDNAYNRVAEWAYGSVGGSTTINGGKIQSNTITSQQLSISDFSNYSQLRVGHNLSNKYGTATYVNNDVDNHCYWNNGDNEYFPFTVNETVNPFKYGDKVGFKFDAYVQNALDVRIGVWFYLNNDCNDYLAERTADIHLNPGWNSYSTQVTIDCTEVRRARSVAILIYKGANNYIEVRNAVISRMISNTMIEDRAVTANKLGTIGGFQVEDRLLRGRNGTEGNNYVGMSGDGFGWAFWAGAYNGGDAPFHVGHEGHLYATNATLAGTLDGNSTTATRLQNARTLTIGNTGKNFDGSGNVSWSLAEIGAAASGHTHDSITSSNTYITTVGNDTYSLDMPNNIDISSWFGVSITNNCANTPNYRQTTVAINARSGEASFRGRITAHGAYMTNNIEFSEAGTSNSSAPGLVWNGSTDGADLYYRTLEADQGQLLINLRDDSNATLAIAWNGEVKATFDANGYYSGSCYKASCLNTRNITVGKTTKTFDGSHDVGFSLGEIGAIGAKGDGAYWGLTNPYDSDTEWIRTTTLGFIPYASGSNSSLGTDSWRFNQGYIDYIHSAEMWSNSFHGYLDGTAYAANKLNDRGVVQCETGTNRSEVGGLSMTQVYNSGHPTPYGNVLSLRGMGDGQILVGWSGASGAHAPVYVRSKRDNGDAPWSDWAQFYTTAHPQSDISGNAGSASRLQYARTFTVGNTGKNFDGTNNVSWSLDEIGAAPSSHGHNFMYVKGTNTIGSVNDDTTSNWGAQQNSVHWYAGVEGCLHDQPSSWGYLLNIGQGSEVHQLWMTQASGNLLHRGGNGSGWSGSWKTILDSDNYTAWAAAKSHTHNYAGSPSAGGSAYSLYLPRVKTDACFHPGANATQVHEFSSDSSNLPNGNYYHVLTNGSQDTNYASQLALGMTTSQVHYRNFNAGSWGGWNKLAFENDVVKKSGDTMSGTLTSNAGFCVDKNGRQLWLDSNDSYSYIWASGPNKSIMITHDGDLNFENQPIIYGGRGNNYDTAVGTIYFNNSGKNHKGRISCYTNDTGTADYVQLALRTSSDTINSVQIYDDTVAIKSNNIKIGGKKLTIATSAPSSPSTGDVWINIG